ncbi:hypothetical protein ACRE_079810 [Hapsidospora chrysogenum ATCC 11550]|uniref:Ribosome assembly protein 3 n=1 Tax=Hapsidospora chrysogenum (strain ATCC 11550 / CBS 779.69 / DSM 880 / IAM 14645 / JCM 23072 / IMI 49137) TaxID=857340 RepID=A0A086SW21_HAPC1|nr:hypothetical protein ACRE_079810 [Hapsidospora chrysogenum ATCC 11550]
MSQKADKKSPETQAAFESFYLQRSTRELAEDLDNVRNADDFKADSVQFLVHALQQGASQFGPHDQDRVMSAVKGGKDS